MDKKIVRILKKKKKNSCKNIKRRNKEKEKRWVKKRKICN